MSTLLTRERLQSHGRDHKLRTWQVREEDISGLSTKLPADRALPDQKHPWLLHSMSVNALNFCAFALCDEDARPPDTTGAVPQLLAAPNGLDSGGIDLFQLPSEKRVSQVPSDKHTATGMVMAVSLVHCPEPGRLALISGYEDGQVMIHLHQGAFGSPGQWQRVMISKPHSQPILSIDLLPSKTHFLSSSADAKIAKFSLITHSSHGTDAEQAQPEKAVNTKHAGQQGLSVRSDGKIFATAGWDGRVRVYSVKTLKELAVLKWHQGGCYSTAFAAIDADLGGSEDQEIPPPPLHPEISNNSSTEIATRLSALDLIKRKREEKARTTHWLAAGGKDGKISLWDIY